MAVVYGAVSLWSTTAIWERSNHYIGSVESNTELSCDYDKAGQFMPVAP